MTITFLAKMLTPQTTVTLKDADTNEVIKVTTAEEIVNNNYCDTVKDWDFSNEHEVYI